MSELGLAMMGKDPNGNARGIKTDETGVLEVNQPGNRIEVSTIYTEEIRTSNTLWVTFDARKYSSFEIVVSYSLDEPINISGYRDQGYALSEWDGEKWVITRDNQPLILETLGAYRITDHPAISPIKGFGRFVLRLRFPQGAPTSGALSIEIHGRVL